MVCKTQLPTKHDFENASHKKIDLSQKRSCSAWEDFASDKQTYKSLGPYKFWYDMWGGEGEGL